MSQPEIRSYIEVITEMLLTESAQPEMLVEDTYEPAPAPMALMEEELAGLIFKLRSYQDPEPGAYAEGVEAGMTRAAEMLQNMIDRLRGE